MVETLLLRSYYLALGTDWSQSIGIPHRKVGMAACQIGNPVDMAAGMSKQTREPLQTLFGTRGYQGIPFDIRKLALLCSRIGSQYCIGFDFRIDLIDTQVGKTFGTVGNLVDIQDWKSDTVGNLVDIQDWNNLVG